MPTSPSKVRNSTTASRRKNSSRAIVAEATQPGMSISYPTCRARFWLQAAIQTEARVRRHGRRPPHPDVDRL